MLELQQERKQAVVLVHAAVGDDDVQRPVHLEEIDLCQTEKLREVERGEGNNKEVK